MEQAARPNGNKCRSKCFEALVAMLDLSFLPLFVVLYRVSIAYSSLFLTGAVLCALDVGCDAFVSRGINTLL